MKGLFISLGVGLVLIGSIVLWAIGVSNAEIKLRAKISGQQEMTEAFYTKLWEVIRTKAGIPAIQRDTIFDKDTINLSNR
jgi:hypothetical protein